jgi:hypothetical protein
MDGHVLLNVKDLFPEKPNSVTAKNRLRERGKQSQSNGCDGK